MILAAAVVLAAVVVAAEAFRWWSADRLLRDRRTAKVVVELVSGETFQGVLSACDRESVVLRNVSSLFGPESVPTVVDGELLIPRGDIKFLQRP